MYDITGSTVIINKNIYNVIFTDAYKTGKLVAHDGTLYKIKKIYCLHFYEHRLNTEYKKLGTILFNFKVKSNLKKLNKRHYTIIHNFLILLYFSLF